jgi:hypothetical protein
MIRLLNDSVRSDDPPAWLERKKAGVWIFMLQVIRKQDEELADKAASRKRSAMRKPAAPIFIAGIP